MRFKFVEKITLRSESKINFAFRVCEYTFFFFEVPIEENVDLSQLYDLQKFSNKRVKYNFAAV